MPAWYTQFPEKYCVMKPKRMISFRISSSAFVPKRESLTSPKAQPDPGSLVWLIRRALSRRRYLTSRHFYTQLDIEDAIDRGEEPRTDSSRLDELIDQHSAARNLEEIFQTLSENQRQTLRLFFIEGYTFDEIAAKLGQSRGNVKHHYFRGLEKLRKELFGSKLPGERAI